MSNFMLIYFRLDVMILVRLLMVSLSLVLPIYLTLSQIIIYSRECEVFQRGNHAKEYEK